LACRQCHIDASGFVKRTRTTSPSHSWNDQGAIQDFGACFACHAPTPYHGKPTQTPYCWDLSSQYLANAAPGKGSFNIFARELQHPEGYWENTQYENLADQYCAPQSQSDWYNPKISFNWFSITSTTSSAYPTTVPYFGPPSGGGTCDVKTSGTYVESESYNTLGDNWQLRTDNSSANGGKHLYATRNSTSNVSGTSAQYRLNFTQTGTYYIWFRSNDNRSSGDDTLWYGLDGARVGDIDSPNSNYNWNWVRNRSSYGPSTARIVINSTGVHTINIWAKENGHRLDGFYLTTSSSTISGSIPSGATTINPSGCGL